MSTKTRLFVALIALAGVSCIVQAGRAVVDGVDALRFVSFLALAVLSSGLNVKLPGIDGTMSVNFLFILVGIADFGFAQTMAFGLAATLVQCFWGRKKPASATQLIFNLFGMMPLAIGTAYFAYSTGGRLLGGSIPLALVASGCSYFLANTLPVAVVISLSEGKSFRKIWSECYFWSFPYYLVGAGAAALVHWMNQKIGWQTSLLVLPAIYWVYRSYRMYLDRLEAEKSHVESMAALHLRTIEALALAIEAKDHTTHDHLQRVGVYAVAIAQDMKADDQVIEALRAAALLHDIGKLAVPEHIINKPGKLTAEEFEKMKIHPLVGADILERVAFPYPVAPIVRAHHEKWDGTGYPFGLKGEEIPLGARILSVVDCFDALASDRQYRRAMEPGAALAEVERLAGSEFDPKVVEVLKRRFLELQKESDASKSQSDAAATAAESAKQCVPAAGLEKKVVGVDPHFLSSIAAARQEAQSLFELSHDLGNSLSLDETLSVLAVRLSRMVPYDSIAVFIVRGNKLVPKFVSGDNFRLLSNLEITMGQGLLGWVAQNRKPIVNGNPAVEDGYSVDTTKHAVLQSALCIPLETINGVVGVLALYRTELDAFSHDHLRILMAINSKIALSIENALRFEVAETSATTDYLTELPNARSLFLHLENELARTRRSGRTLAVLVCDLNGFKSVNDRFGHLEGNRVLQIFARSLRSMCREYDYVARMGGDEFVIVLPEAGPEAASAKAKLIHEAAMMAGEQVCGERVLGASVGTAYSPSDGLDAEELLAEADKRMYIEKKAHHASKNSSSLPPKVIVMGRSASVN